MVAVVYLLIQLVYIMFLSQYCHWEGGGGEHSGDSDDDGDDNGDDVNHGAKRHRLESQIT